MFDLEISDNQLDPNGYWDQTITHTPCPADVDLFDQNGYDLTPIEQQFAGTNARLHREHRYSLKQSWLTQAAKIEGAVLNHSLLFERKGYSGEALEDLTAWAQDLPLLHKVISIRPKWGIDFSMDYVDRAGNVFEVLHWEYDGFDYNQIQDQKITHEQKFVAIDWDDAGARLLKRKDEWYHLEFFDQSAWKCRYFGIVNERFKIVIWK